MYRALAIGHIGLDTSLIKADLFSAFVKQNNFTSGTVSFKEFKLADYPNQEEAYTLIDKEYKNKYGEYYWCGDKYETLEVLFNALNEQKLIIELTVKV